MDRIFLKKTGKFLLGVVVGVFLGGVLVKDVLANNHNLHYRKAPGIMQTLKDAEKLCPSLCRKFEGLEWSGLTGIPDLSGGWKIQNKSRPWGIQDPAHDQRMIYPTYCACQSIAATK